MSLGGDGGLNLPFEALESRFMRDPPPDGWEVGTGVIVKAIVLEHPLTKRPHPGLLMQFARPNGTFSRETIVVLEVDELEALTTVIGDAIKGAIEASKRGSSPHA